MKTAEQIAEEIVTEITTGGTVAFAGLDRSPTLHEMERAIALRAIKAYQAERSPVLIDPDEAQGLADRFREAAEGDSGDAEISAACDMAEYLESLAAAADMAEYLEAHKATEDETIPPVPLDVFADIDERVGSQDYAPYTLAAHDNGGYVDVVVLKDTPSGESVYKYTREPDGSVKWELLAARAHRSDA